MTRKLLNLAAVILLTCSLGLAAEAPEMTNQDVVDMFAAKLSVDFIVKTIEGSAKASFDVRPSELIRLKKSGVDERILSAMVARANRSDSLAADSASSSNAAGALSANLPDAVGVFYKRGGIYDELPQEMVKGRQSAGRLMMGGIMKFKVEHKIPGRTSKLQVVDDTPAFLVHLPGRDVGKMELILVKEVRDNERLLFTVEGRTSGNIVRTLVPVSMAERGSGYIEIWPKDPLSPGEYAIVDYEDIGVPPRAWPFTITR